MTKEYAEVAFADYGSAVTMGDDQTEAEENLKRASLDSDDVVQEDDDDVPPAEGGDESGGDTEGDSEDGDTEGDDSDTLGLSEEDLSAFDPEDQEVVSKYDEAFTLEDGSLDMDGALSSLFWKNVEAGKEGLDEGVYQYLESKGIKKATVKQVEAMAQTQKDAQEQSVKSHDGELFAVAGGPDELSKALEWGKKGGYSKEQQERFNKVNNGKDLEAKKEAVEVLMARFKKANPVQRPRVPQRDATKGGGGKANGALPFKDRGEMRQMRDSLRENDSAGWALFRKRRNASNF